MMGPSFDTSEYSNAKLGLGLDLGARQRSMYRAAQGNPNAGYGMFLPRRAQRALMAGRQAAPTLQNVASLAQGGMLTNIARRRANGPGGPPPAPAPAPQPWHGLGEDTVRSFIAANPNWASDPTQHAALNAMVNRSMYGTETPSEAQQISGNPGIAAATGMQPRPAVNPDNPPTQGGWADVLQAATTHPGMGQPFDPNDLVNQARAGQYADPAARQAAINQAQVAEHPVQAARRQMRQQVAAAQGPLARSQARIAGMQAVQNARYNDPNSAYNEQLARRAVPRAMRGRMAAY
jgi:hypothetical protein